MTFELVLGVGCSVEEYVVRGWIGLWDARRVTEREFFLEQRGPVTRQEQGRASPDGFGEGLRFHKRAKDKTIIQQEGQPQRHV
jgi:hypothetical protein